MSRRDWTVRQRPTHAGLLGRATAPVWASASSALLDAIIVPAARPADNLTDAILLARGAGTHLVVLCSKETDPCEVLHLAGEQRLSAVTAVTIPRDYGHSLFEFDTTKWVKNELPSMCDVRDSDLSVKRNIGLALACLLGWRRIFFMDDDIRYVTATDLRKTVSAIGTGRGYRSVGMTIDGFPDNSVVCHARRGIGRYQDVFVSGSVLAVDTNAPFDYFPDIYNEDWLFFYRDAANRRLGRSHRKAWQLRYDPFADPKRAAGQEFGDVLAEGLYALLDSGQDETSADKQFWNNFLDARRKFIADIEARQEKTSDEVWKRMGIALQAARLCLAEITADMCTGFITQWQNDRDQWAAKMTGTRSALSIQQALSLLHLDPGD